MDSVRISCGGKFVCEAGVARSPWRKALGLMFRGSLGEGEGLLLDFGQEGRFGIWMLFMRFPIDVVFLDKEWRVVGLHKRARPFAPWRPGTWKVYYPESKARYALEIRAGAVERVGITVDAALEKHQVLGAFQSPGKSFMAKQ
jgi:uncharacterized membrane protein (UPF0127 family)